MTVPNLIRIFEVTDHGESLEKENERHIINYFDHLIIVCKLNMYS